MPRPPEMPALDSPNARVRWWREYRSKADKGFARRAFAAKLKISYSGLSDFENGRTHKHKDLHLIIATLRLNPYYVETGKGEPEAGFSQEPPHEPSPWPFTNISRAKIDKLNLIERSYLEGKLFEGLADIESERKKAKHG